MTSRTAKMSKIYTNNKNYLQVIIKICTEMNFKLFIVCSYNLQFAMTLWGVMPMLNVTQGSNIIYNMSD